MKHTDVVILCGGLGTRLKKIISDRPKPMAEIHGRPFLDILINYVATFGLTRFILCTGYMGDYIEDFYKNNDSSQSFLFSKEKYSLGTGGALKNAESLIQSNPFLVMNGDSFCPVDLDAFMDFHINKRAITSIVVSQVDDPGDFGSITMDNENRIISFREKGLSGHKLVNAGIYFMDRKVFSMIPLNTQYSLETELFPRLVNNDFYGLTSYEKVIDIGTPERYEQAKRLL